MRIVPFCVAFERRWLLERELHRPHGRSNGGACKNFRTARVIDLAVVRRPWDGFFRRVRQGHFTPYDFERALKKVSAITLAEDEIERLLGVP